MKKLAFLGLCALASVTAVAQTSLVKDIERQMKSNIEKYPELVKSLNEAFTNPETAESAYPYFVAGKGGYNYFDQLEGFKSIGKQVDDKAMGKAIIDSYDYMKKAIVNDSVRNDKGKVKTKYSKDIVKLILAHHYDYDKAARFLWGANDFNGAYECWDIFLKAPYDPVWGENAPVAPVDTVAAEIKYNQALAAWQAERLDDAITCFDTAYKMGYDKKQLFDYAISVSYAKQDHERMAYYAELAYPLYGNEDSRYIGYVINAKIKNEQYDEAHQLLDSYIQQAPNNGQLYYVRGILFDSQNNFEKACEDYRKAVELDPNNEQALLQLGRQLCNQAYAIDDEASKKSTDEYNRMRTEDINPLFQEAAIHLEKAYQINPETTRDALNFLRNIYYNLNDAENLQRIENLIQNY